MRSYALRFNFIELLRVGDHKEWSFPSNDHFEIVTFKSPRGPKKAILAVAASMLTSKEWSIFAYSRDKTWGLDREGRKEIFLEQMGMEVPDLQGKTRRRSVPHSL